MVRRWQATKTGLVPGPKVDSSRTMGSMLCVSLLLMLLHPSVGEPMLYVIGQQ